MDPIIVHGVCAWSRAGAGVGETAKLLEHITVKFYSLLVVQQRSSANYLAGKKKAEGR